MKNLLSEILDRPINNPIEVWEMEMTVAEYIRARKNVDIKVNIGKGIDFTLPKIMWASHYIEQINKLHIAFEVAKVWFKENPKEI